MFRFDELIPTIDELKRRTHREATIKPSEESKAKMMEIFAEFGYTPDNANVYNSLVGFGALLFDGTARKGLILSGNVGIGKTLGVQIIANKFRIPVLYPKAYIVVANTNQICDKIADNERNIKDIIEAIFNNDFAKAQAIIDGISNYIAEIDEGAKRLIENEKARKERRALRKQGKALPTSASNSQWQAERKRHTNANYWDGI